MTLLYLGLGIILLCVYPFVILARLLGVIDTSWVVLLAAIWVPILATVLFSIGLVGFLGLFSFIIH